MKIEIRSPLRIDRSGTIAQTKLVELLETVKAETSKELTPRIAFGKKVKARMAEQLAKAAAHLTEETKQ